MGGPPRCLNAARAACDWLDWVLGAGRAVQTRGLCQHSNVTVRLLMSDATPPRCGTFTSHTQLAMGFSSEIFVVVLSQERLRFDEKSIKNILAGAVLSA